VRVVAVHWTAETPPPSPTTLPLVKATPVVSVRPPGS
jgi:hypothetical protein